MSEKLSQSQVEDSLSAAESFILTERGAELDGHYAGVQIADRTVRMEQSARSFMTKRPIYKSPGFYAPLSKSNADEFDTAVTTLPGYMVLVPSALVEKGPSQFYPAVVSEDGLKTQELRLHVLRQPYRKQLQYGSAILLSAAGQSETSGVGEHRPGKQDGIEAEHFGTLLATTKSKSLQTAWQNNQHVNHSWRGKRTSSVTSEVSARLFGNEVPQSTITISKAQIAQNKAMLLWHEGMQNEDGRLESASRDNALVIVQGLGFEALRNTNPRGIEYVKRMIAE